MAIGFMMIESAVSLSIPYLIGQFTNTVLYDTNAFDLSVMHLMFVWIGLIVLQAFVRFQSTFRANMVGAQVLNQLSCRLYDHLQMLPIDYFSNSRKGEILSLISNDANILSYFLSGVLIGLIPAAIILFGVTVLMANISLSIALIIIVTIPVFFFTMKLLGRSIRPISEQVVHRQAGGIAIATENFSTIELVKSFGREDIESQKFKENANQILGLRKKQLKVQALLSPLMQMFISIGVVVIVVISAKHYQSGDLSIPQLITMLMYGLLFAKPMSTFAGLYGQLQQASGSSTRIKEVFDIAPESDDIAKFDLQLTKGEVQFKGVSFGYKPENVLLYCVTMSLKPASTTLIVGSNGSGKTSFLHLLMRFMQPQQGQILIDGQDIADSSLSSLRKHIGLVSQDIALCNGSVIDNIAYGFPSANRDAVINAARLSGASDFIEQLKQGYDTQVGENGVLLSGGQRQRISLARALLFDPQILLFDEPTSFADQQGKQEFERLLKSELQQKTVMIVTHDSSMCALVDEVYQLDHQGFQPISIANNEER